MDEKLTRAVTSALEDYYGTVRVSDVIQAYDGGKSALARALAGISPDGSLPRAGTPERTRYNSQLKVVGRYLDYEKQGAKSKGNRNPENKAAQKKLRDALASKRPPAHMTITIMGEIAISEDVRDRTVTIDSPHGRSIDVEVFLDAMKRGNEEDAYAAIFEPYCSGMHVNTLDEVDIDFS